MALNARKHTVPAPADATITRAMIFETFGNSIRDVVPVANATERAQLVTDLTAKGQAPSASRPLVVYRNDARGLHRIEYTFDGSVWIPASGVLEFPSKTVADSWGTANGGLLTAGDECRIGGVGYIWGGTAWSMNSQTGTVTAPALNAGATGALPAVTFPIPFPRAPFVILRDTGGRKTDWGGTVSTTGFQRNVLNISDGAAASEPMQWAAFLI